MIWTATAGRASSAPTTAVRQIQAGDKQAAQQAVEARLQFYRENAASFAIGAPRLLKQDARYKSVFYGSSRPPKQ